MQVKLCDPCLSALEAVSSYDDALYISTYTLFYFTLYTSGGEAAGSRGQLTPMLDVGVKAMSLTLNNNIWVLYTLLSVQEDIFLHKTNPNAVF